MKIIDIKGTTDASRLRNLKDTVMPPNKDFGNIPQLPDGALSQPYLYRECKTAVSTIISSVVGRDLTQEEVYDLVNQLKDKLDLIPRHVRSLHLLECEDCLSVDESVENQIDPYQQDIGGTEVYRDLCSDCINILSDEI